MPPDDVIPGTPTDWLLRAESHLALCRHPKPPGALWEDLAFHAHAAAEFALKGVYQYRRLRFRYTHNLAELGRGLEKAGAVIPQQVKESVILNRYVVHTRYPAVPLRVTEDEFRAAVRLAEAVVEWAKSVITQTGSP
jgi:HEPN domain-containing protein